MIRKGQSSGGFAAHGERPATLRILVLDDHEILRRGLCALIEEQPGWKVYSSAVDGGEAVKFTKMERPDVVVLDLSTPESDGLHVLRKIKAALPATEVVVLSAKDSKEAIEQAFEAGAKGYLRKGEAAEWLVSAIRTVATRKIFLTPEGIDVVFAKPLSPERQQNRPRTGGPLTAREQEIVCLLAQSHSNKETAAKLGVSLRTIEAHRANIMRKLGFHALADLVRYAIRNEIIEA